jgi:hypothetical protein
MKYGLIMLLVFFLSSCSTAGAAELEADVDLLDLPDFGAAPELTSEVWLNSEQPLRIADLRGQVVLLEMWTFG